MADVFISYSRKDKAFVQMLQRALEKAGRDTWVDWQDIPLTAEWWKEIEAGIEAANTFVFVISPDSAQSQICMKEIDYAAANNKRLLPIVRRDDFDLQRVHPLLSKHNWLVFRETDDFEQAFQALIQALDTDLKHVRNHTRLLVRAKEWDAKGRNDSFLLRGDDLREAEQWLQQGSSKTPTPTEQHKNYIRKSREAENASRRAKTLIGIGASVMTLTLSIAVVAVFWAWQDIESKRAIAQDALQRAEQAEQQEKIAVEKAEQAKQLAEQAVAESQQVTTTLATAKDELAQVQQRYQSERQNLEGAQQELTQIKADLEQNQQALDAAVTARRQAERGVLIGDSRLELLQRVQRDFQQARQQVVQLRVELNRCQARISELTAQE